jgi:vitamin B12 transporter
MLNKKFPVLLTCFTLIFTFLGEVVYSDDESITLEEIVITATRTEMEILDAPAHVSVITAEEIEDMGVQNISEVLGRQPGISIIDYGSEGTLKNVYMRGTTSSGVLVLINGVRLNDSRQGGIDLSLIPLHSIEKIEIVRGGTSALYGADAVGGIINIITKKKADDKLIVRLENGSYIPKKSVEIYDGPTIKNVDADVMALFDTQKVSLQYSKGIGNINLVTSGSFTRANNEFIWDDSDYGGRKMINADMLGGDAYLSIAIPMGSGKFDTSGFFCYAKKGAPGSVKYFSTDATQTDTLAGGYAHYTTDRFLSDFLTLDSKLSYKYSSLDFEDPDPVFPMDDLHELHSFGIDVSQELLYFDYLSFVYGANLLFETSESTKIGKNDRISGGIFLESPIYLLTNFTLIPAARYDYYSDFPDSINFKLSGVYNISTSSSLKINLSKSYRAPTLNDLYWPYTAPFMGWSGESGNPDLKPETGYSIEAGVSTIKDRISYDIFAFVRYMQDEIQWNLDTTANIWRPENIGQTLYPGIEAGFSSNIFWNLWLNANYTFIYSFVLKAPGMEYDFSDDKRAPWVPVHSIDAGIEYRGKRDLIGLNAKAESKRYIDPENTGSTEAYLVLSGHYKRLLSDHLTLLLSVNNLLNKKYVTKDGYIMPPLFIRTGIEFVF